MKKASSIIVVLALVVGLGGVALAQSPSSFSTTSTTTSTSTTGGSGTTTTTTSTTTNNTLMCNPQTQTARVGQNVFFSASGGTGTYRWNVPEITLSNPFGTGLWMNYGSTGLKTITVTSGNQTATCLVTVTSVPGGIGDGGLPGLPNTGEGGEVTNNLLWLLVGLSVVGGVTILSYKGLTQDNL